MFAEEKLKALNNKDVTKDVFKDMLDSRNWINSGKDLHPVEQCAAEVNEMVKHDNIEVIKDGLYYKARLLSGGLIELEVPFKKASDITEIAIEEQIKKCREKITSGDYDGAITNARSLVETLLASIEKDLDPNAPEPDGELVRAFNRVRGLLNLDPSRKDISDALSRF